MIKRKTMSVRKKYSYLLLAFVLFAAAGYYMYHEYNRKPISVSELLPVYELTTPALIGSFQKTESLANQQYLGKVLSVSGRIKSLDTDPNGFYTVILGDTASMSSVRCSMAVKIADDSMRYKPGLEVVIKGICTGYTPDNMGLGSDVILNRCVLIKSLNL